MKLAAINPTGTDAWKRLQKHYERIQHIRMGDLFADDAGRAERFSVEWNDFLLDFSKNRMDAATFQTLMDLARETQVKEAISLQFDGAPINETEGRAVLHTALRDLDNTRPEVKEALSKMERFSEKIISGEYKGYTGKTIDTIVNIGIGGSDLGPKLVVEALRYYRNHVNVHFISNVDGDHVESILSRLDPECTVFIVVSKSFGTQETLTNAKRARQWLGERISPDAISSHFVAVSANPSAVAQFGIAEENLFPIWDWVGGRFSLWSAVGLSICCAVGYRHFHAMLRGAHAMDEHFKTSEFNENIPVIIAMLSVWYVNFFGYSTEAVIPYCHDLKELVPYLQQVAMESNGKQVDRDGKRVAYSTCPVVWGHVGTNAQHAFFQLLHQGTHTVPADFIAFKKNQEGTARAHDILLANCLAQTEALLLGSTAGENLPSHCYFEGDKPTNTLLVNELNPYNLGGLLALYEHKYFVQGVVWNIFSYDQWGVELGKKIAQRIQSNKESGHTNHQTTSTAFLLKQLKK